MAQTSASLDSMAQMKRDLERLGETATAETIKADLKRFIDSLSEDEALSFLDMVNNWLDGDELTPDEEEEIRRAREEIARGEFVTLEAYRRIRNL
jgi:hypothetical protein